MGIDVVSDDDRFRTPPPVGAAALSTIVTTVCVPPISVVGDAENDAIGGAATFRLTFHVWLTPRYEPVIVAVAGEETAVVLTVKLTVFALTGIVTLAGTVRFALLLDNVTTAPPGGANAVRVAAPVTEVPPATSEGAETADRAAGCTWSGFVNVTVDWVVVMLTVFVVVTPRVAAWNVADEAP